MVFSFVAVRTKFLFKDQINKIRVFNFNCCMYLKFLNHHFHYVNDYAILSFTCQHFFEIFWHSQIKSIYCLIHWMRLHQTCNTVKWILLRPNLFFVRTSGTHFSIYVPENRKLTKKVKKSY